MKTGAPSVEWALGTDLKQKQMVLGILWECWMVLFYFPPTNLVSFPASSKVLQWQRGWLCVQRGANALQWDAALLHSMVCYKHGVNLHVWACFQFVFLRSKIRTAPLGERTWERGVPTTHENIWNTLKNSSRKATGFLKTEYPTVGSLEN